MGAGLGGDLPGLDLGAHAAAREIGAGGTGHGFDLRRDAGNERHELGAAAVAGRAVVQPFDIGQEHQEIGAGHGGDARRQPIVVAVTDLVRRHRVVLVDHRHRAPVQQPGNGGAGVEIAAALLGIAEREQHLAGGDPVAPERLGPGARERDLADRRGGLAVFELERSDRKLEPAAAERDRARRDDQEVACLAMQVGDIFDQRGEPRLVERAGLGIDEQGRADLDDDAVEVGEARNRHGLDRQPVVGSQQAVIGKEIARPP
jgi:hypothetical protein